MEFVFIDKNKVEKELITDILYEEKIPYKISKQKIEHVFFDEIEEEELFYVEEIFDIHINTDLNHYDYLTYLINKKTKQLDILENSFLLKLKENKNVHKLHKKNITNTDNKYRNK